MERRKIAGRALSLLLAVIMVLVLLPMSSLAVNKTTTFSAPYKSGKYYTQLMNAKKEFGSDKAKNFVAVVESQLGYREGSQYKDLSGTLPGGTKKLSYWDTKAKKYKTYSGALDTCEYNFWFYTANDKSPVTKYTSTTTKPKGAAYPVSNYDKAWCAAFVSWCAAQAGVSSLIPTNGGCGNLYRGILKKGGKDVTGSTLKSGDVVFYYCSKCKVYTHTGVVSSDTRYSIEGNTNGGVSKVNLTKATSNTCSKGHTAKRLFARPAFCNHSSTYTKVTKAPTCQSTGVKTTYCKSCNAQVKTQTLAKTGHSYDKYSHCTTCGAFYPMTGATVKAGVYTIQKNAPLHSTPYSKGKGGKSNTTLTIPKGSVVTVEYGGKNKARNLWYYVSYTDKNGKVTEGYLYSGYAKFKQNSFKFYEGIQKLFTVTYGGTPQLPKTSKTTKSGYTLQGFNIYKKVTGKSAQYLTTNDKWYTAAQAKKNGSSYKLFQPGSYLSLDRRWITAENKNTTYYVLVPVWKKLGTCNVTYNANGGTGAPAAQTKTTNVNLQLSTAVPKRSGYVFKGWATSSGGKVAYASGATYTGNANLTLYAVWEKIPITWKTVYVKNIKSTSALVGTTVTTDCSKVSKIGLQMRIAGGSWKTVASWKVNNKLDYCTVQCGTSKAEAPALKKNTTYEYRFFVNTSNVGVQYSPQKSFKTSK